MLKSKSKMLSGAAVALVLAVSTAHADDKPMTRMNGAPVGDNQNSTTAGEHGPVLLQDHHLIEKLAGFDRERIPERVVHARGTGAYGEFTATADLGELTRAMPFQEAGKKTPVFVRFSTVIHGKGSPETARDPHGFAVKFYTEDGNWDLVGNNLPIFFIRDAIKFPDMIHSLKPDPRTNLQDPNRFFDFFSHIPEATHMITRTWTPLGIPASYREMDGSGVHAFKFVTADCKVNYVKFTWKSRQGVKGLTPKQAADVQGKNFSHLTADLYQNIDAGNFPVWDLYIQTMNPADIDSYDFNPLDDTKIWPEDQFPSRKVGELVLNKVPDNFHQHTEQAALAPSNMIPGIEPSEDRMLQGRLFSYADTQRYRLGINHMSFPVNASRVEINSHIQDGAGQGKPRSGSVNYQPSRTMNYADNEKNDYCRYELTGTTQQQPISKTQNFKQAGEFYRELNKTDRDALIQALTGDLGAVTNREIRTIMTSFFYKADADYGTRVAKGVNVDLAEVRKLAASYTD